MIFYFTLNNSGICFLLLFNVSLACTYRQNCAHINDIQVLYFEICILSIVAKYIYTCNYLFEWNRDFLESRPGCRGEIMGRRSIVMNSCLEIDK